jgi:uncharacterized membrane protein
MAEQRSYQLESLIGSVLRIGVIVSSATIALGLLLLLVTGRTGYTPIQHGAALPSLIVASDGSGGQFPTDLADTLSGVAEGRPFAIISLGLLLLIATPMVRVAVTVVAFALRRDLVYLAFTAFVLTMLLVGFCLGKATQ